MATGLAGRQRGGGGRGEAGDEEGAVERRRGGVESGEKFLFYQ